MKKKRYFCLLAFLHLVTLIFYPAMSHAQNEDMPEILDAREIAEKEMKKKEKKIKWEIHRSVTNIFETKFPRKYKYKIFPFQFNDDTVAFAVEVLSSLDDENSGKKEKSVMINAVQTFSHNGITYRDVDRIIKRETRKYMQSARQLNGTVLTNEDVELRGFPGKKIYISYDINGKKYGIRILLLITNYSKVEHVLSGPKDTMYSYRSNDFFESIKVFDGITKKKNPIGVGWVDYTSPNNIFTVKLPPKNSYYAPTLPKFSATPAKGRMRFVITDPVLEKDVIYNVYSYKNKKKLSRKEVKTILFSKHVSKFVKNASIDTLKTEDATIGDIRTMKTKLIITPTDIYPDISTIFFEATYKGDTLVVQEFLCSKRHAKSGLNRTLFSLMEFHPEKYKAVEMPAKKEEQPPASEAK